MKSLIITQFVVIAMFLPVLALGQQRPGLTAGLHLTETGQQFGIGLNVSTPAFARGMLAVRATGTMSYYEVPGTTEQPMDWSRFAQARLGLVSYAPVCACGVRVYGETGPATFRPNPAFADGGWQVGWYGLFGAEFLMSEQSLFFFEMGGQGISSDRAGMPGDYPSIANGFIAAAGFRIQAGRK
ncbi:MAG: hypothetical protein SF053_02580 [Bacteroidia bacterium]|nr:hypothetical protein [Bacteroidia bacterium]